MEISIQTTDDVIIKPKSWRWRPDGTYNDRPLDPNYFNNYYQLNKHKRQIESPCPHCHYPFKTKALLRKHLTTRTKNCLLMQELTELKGKEEEKI